MKCPLWPRLEVAAGLEGGGTLRYGPTAVERAMRMQEVILRALSGELSWMAAADILRMSPRTLRRWKRRYKVRGYDGLLDRRTGRP
jgi:transposase